MTDKPLKIDFLINKMSGGGAERVVSILANHFAEQGYKIRVITFTGTDNYELHDTVERVQLHRHPLFHSVVFNGFFSLLFFYFKKKNRPDIMSSHIDLLGYLTIPISKLFRIKLIVSEHNNHLANPSLGKRVLWNYLYPFVDSVTILTDFDATFFKEKNKNVWLMPNPCTFEKIIPQVRVSEPSKTILAIGDLNRYHHKGFDNLIEIAAKVLKIYPDSTFKIVGGGDTGLKFLTELALKYDILEKIVFTGFRTDIKKQLGDCDIFILPSRFEGLPMTLLEAMSQGTCCIAYDCISGPSDVITHDVNGILVEDQNVEMMVLGLTRLIENEDLRARFRYASPNAIDKFSIENVGSRWEKLFQSML